MTYLLGRSKEINTYIAWKKREAARYSLIQRQTLPWRMLLSGRENQGSSVSNGGATCTRPHRLGKG